jgi:hypothetical protein
MNPKRVDRPAPIKAREAERDRKMRLDKQEEKSLVHWTTDCAEHLLPYFKENYTRDDRPGTRTDQVIRSV